MTLAGCLAVKIIDCGSHQRLLARLLGTMFVAGPDLVANMSRVLAFMDEAWGRKATTSPI
jgi:hypothetical protein